MLKDSKIYIAGHGGLVGSAIQRKLEEKGYHNIVTRTRAELDLLNQEAVNQFFAKEQPAYVVLAAAKVGGIVANNTYRAQFLYENLQIQNNIIHQAYLNKVQKMLVLGSSCIYPKNAPQPLKEEYLLTSELEYTNEPYAIAKIAGLKMCESYNLQYGTNFIAAMPTNLYGPNDNYDLEKSHVLPALIRKMHLGKCLEQNDWEGICTDLNKLPIEGVNGKAGEKVILEKLAKFGIQKTGNGVNIELWGSGKPMREFLHSDDLAGACVYLLEEVDFDDLAGKPENGQVINTHINIGTGKDITIKALAELVKGVVGFNGKLNWNIEKPDGTFRKVLDTGKINKLGWKPSLSLEEGIRSVHGRYK